MMGRTVVLGIGNPIMGDDGIGLELLELIQDSGPQDVVYLHGGTAGLELLPELQGVDNLLVVDAVVTNRPGGDAPGDVVVLHNEDIPRLLRVAVSIHQLGLVDLLGTLRLLKSEPSQVVVVGIVPDSVEVRAGLSPVAARSLPTASAQALDILTQWQTC